MPAVGCGRVDALRSSRRPTTFICPLRLVALGKGRCRGRRAMQGCSAALSSGEQRSMSIPLDLNLYAAAAGIDVSLSGRYPRLHPPADAGKEVAQHNVMFMQ